MWKLNKFTQLKPLNQFIRSYHSSGGDHISHTQIPKPPPKIKNESFRKVSESTQAQLHIPNQLIWKASNLAELEIPKHDYRCNLISHYYPYAREETHKWENQMYRMADQKAFIRQDFPMFAALAYPRAVSEKKLLIASKFASMAFAMDTDLELMITNDNIDGVYNYAESALNVLKGKPYNHSYATLVAFDQLFQDFGSDATEYQYNNMNWAYQQFVKADHVLSINFNIPKRVIPLHRYFEFSRPNSCSNLLTTLIDYELGFCLEQRYHANFLNNETTIALINNCNDYLALSNDIISLPKEYLNFEVKNYVMCHSMANGCDLRTSMDATLALLYQKVKTINRLDAKIRESNILPEEELSLWLEGFYDVMYGVAQWYQFSDRYTIDNINYNASDVMAKRIQQIRDNDGQRITFDTSDSGYLELYENLHNDWAYFRIDSLPED